MKMPWHNQISLPKAAALFALLLLVSLGLCGANAALFSRFATISGGTPPPDRPVWASMTLMTTGFFELIGMAIGALGLLAVTIAALIKVVTQFFNPKSEDSE